MSATEAEQVSPPAASAIELAPLDASSLPPAVAKLVAGATPAKLMAAKGLAPLRPPDLALALYQLAFDADAAVRAAAEAAPGALADKVLLPMLGEALPAPVLHHLATRLPPSKTEALEKVLSNHAVADQTFAALATRLAERELEIICQNEARLLRCPAIVSALFANPNARMSSVNRAIELCARNGVRVEGIPAFDEVAQAIRADATATDAAVDASFAAVVAETAQAEPAPELAADAAATVTPKPAEAGRKKGGVVDFAKLKLYEKIRLATLGNAFCRATLVRDPNKLVALAAVKSPLVTESEVVAFSASKALSEDVIRHIATSRDHTKHYAVKLNLTLNPKTPIALSLKFLSLLRSDDVKRIASSKNVPTALATAARRIATKPGQ